MPETPVLADGPTDGPADLFGDGPGPAPVDLFGDAPAGAPLPEVGLPPAPPPADGPAHVQLRPHEYELQASVGDAIRGPFDVYTLQELIYAGQLSGDEGVRPPGAVNFTPLRALPEAAAILERYREEAAVVRVLPRKAAAAPAPAPPPAVAAAAAEVARQVNPVRVGLMVVFVLLLVALGAVGALVAGG